MAKHKQIHRWAASTSSWDDQVVVSCATLIESDKQFRLLGCTPSQAHRVRGPAERQFSAAVGYRERWDKDAYPSVGWQTRDGALRGLVNAKRKAVEQAAATLVARKRELASVEDQIKNNKFKVLRTEYEETK